MPWRKSNPNLMNITEPIQLRAIDTHRAYEVKVIMPLNNLGQSTAEVKHCEGYVDSGQFQTMIDHQDPAVISSQNLVAEMVRPLPTDDPPENPPSGFTCVVGQNPTGAFIGNEGKIAQWDNDEWDFSKPFNLYTLMESATWSLMLQEGYLDDGEIT